MEMDSVSNFGINMPANLAQRIARSATVVISTAILVRLRAPKLQSVESVLVVLLTAMFVRIGNAIDACLIKCFILIPI